MKANLPTVGMRVRMQLGADSIVGTVDEVVKMYQPHLSANYYIYRFVVSTGRPYPNARISFFGGTPFEVVK